MTRLEYLRAEGFKEEEAILIATKEKCPFKVTDEFKEWIKKQIEK